MPIAIFIFPPIGVQMLKNDKTKNIQRQAISATAIFSLRELEQYTSWVTHPFLTPNNSITELTA